MPKLSSPKVWNLVAIIVLGGMATEQILGFRDNNPTALVMWISSAIASELWRGGFRITKSPVIGLFRASTHLRLYPI
ncbi:hypothetical protein [Corynebacterium glutamicum]|uniref:hypothetical protein n=1 Tax=Corynebacterium glutamicum TaxID=1718 RepID=UPI0020B14FA4|nr:hypothetical protein [Corynebacterium glutamicum]